MPLTARPQTAACLNSCPASKMPARAVSARASGRPSEHARAGARCWSSSPSQSGRDLLQAALIEVSQPPPPPSVLAHLYSAASHSCLANATFVRAILVAELPSSAAKRFRGPLSHSAPDLATCGCELAAFNCVRHLIRNLFRRATRDWPARLPAHHLARQHPAYSTAATSLARGNALALAQANHQRWAYVHHPAALPPKSGLSS